MPQSSHTREDRSAAGVGPPPQAAAIMPRLATRAGTLRSMGASLAGVALAAGAGSRLAPITDTIPKPLCTVAAETLLDLALARLATVDAEAAVNVHHGAGIIRASVGNRAHVEHEVEEALGTAGAVANLRPFIDGRATVVVNGDTWCPGGLDALVDGWDGERVRGVGARWRGVRATVGDRRDVVAVAGRERAGGGAERPL